MDPPHHHEAATRIQRISRGYRVRKSVRPTALEHRGEHEASIRRSESALTLQNFFRVLGARRVLRSLGEERERQRRLAAAALTHRFLLALAARTQKSLIIWKSHSAAAVQLQRFARGMIIRQRHRNWRYAWHRTNALRRYHDAAAAIQAVVRGSRIRKMLPLLRAANLAETCLENGMLDLQRVCRGFLARRGIMAGERHRAEIAKLKARAEVAARAFALKQMNRNRLSKLRDDAALRSRHLLRAGCATMIQKTYRGHLARERFQLRLAKYRAGLFLHQVVEGYLVRAYELSGLYHKQQLCTFRKKEVACAVRIQALFRMIATKRRVWCMQIYTRRIQKAGRAHKERRALHVHLRERSVRKIQLCFREYMQRKLMKARHLQQRERLALDQERTLAAIIVQAAERRRAARSRYVEEQRVRKIAAIRVQRLIRRMVANFEVEKIRREWRENMLARRVQRRWFAYTTEIKENFEIRRLDNKITTIVLRSIGGVETTARMAVEDEWSRWAGQTATAIFRYNELLRDMMTRVEDWETRGRYCAARMARLRDAQRFARGIIARKQLRRGLEFQLRDDMEAGDKVFKFEEDSIVEERKKRYDVPGDSSSNKDNNNNNDNSDFEHVSSISKFLLGGSPATAADDAAAGSPSTSSSASFTMSDLDDDEVKEQKRLRREAAQRAAEDMAEKFNVDEDSEWSWVHKMRRRQAESAARRKLSGALAASRFAERQEYDDDDDYDDDNHQKEIEMGKETPTSDSTSKALAVLSSPPAKSGAATAQMVTRASAASPSRRYHDYINKSPAFASAHVVPTARSLLNAARRHVDIHPGSSARDPARSGNQQQHFVREQHSMADVVATCRLEEQKYLDLSNTHLSLSLLREHFVTVRYATRVVSLNMRNCSLGDDAAIYVLECCSGLDTLEELDLSANPFGDVAATYLVSLLESRPALRFVDLTETLVSRRQNLIIDDLLCRLTDTGNQFSSFTLKGRLTEQARRYSSTDDY